MSVVGAGIIPPILGIVAKRLGSYPLRDRDMGVSACYFVVGVYGMRTQSSATLHTAPTPI
jgi:fucose permease